MSFPKYPAYKDSGVEWLGEVPKHWDVRPLKWLVEQITEKAITSSFQVGLENIEGWTGRFIETDAEFSGDGVEFQKGDVLFGKLRPYLAKVWLADRSGQAVGDFFVLRPNAINCEFLHKYILSPSVIDDLNASTIGAKMPRVGWEDMAGLAVALPSCEEQIQIARFLDHETARIDALIEEQQRLIELLKEKRQTVISHAVTKGLDPSVPMKDSGVEWLGEVPAHWPVVPFGLAFEYQEGPGIMAVDFRDEGVPLIRISGIQGRWVTLDGCNYLEPSKVQGKWAHFRLDKGDLIISGSASMGLVSEVGEDVAGAVAYTGLIKLKPRAKISVRDFIRSVVGSYQFYAQIDLLKAGSTIQHFGPTHLSQMKIVLPPVNEQVQIAAYVADASVQFDELLGEAEKTNALLQERRSALISAAVTGKIDLRGWQPPASTPDPIRVQETA
ncbi:restriction endonuclease subunit S [Pseudomonas oryzae]|uniref:Type I restriction enzyme, S subunit n=1 Tax=Pseudomonas oryzae TaxID=1392877 RepID=A0A1H1MM62_9PSED|nr:restriction endonuclease subunit S [Pseudomonas oryzae]SDR87787.1 type I restriction enzyme, S subunit [Pseudomonas oryzae]